MGCSLAFNIMQIAFEQDFCKWDADTEQEASPADTQSLSSGGVRAGHSQAS